MKKLILLFFVALSSMLNYTLQAQGSTCSDPIPVTSGSNSYTDLYNYTYYSYVVTQPNRLITTYSCGKTQAYTSLNVSLGCDSTIQGVFSPSCGNQSYKSFRANIGDTIVFEWYSGDSAFNWILKDDPYMDPAGSAASNPIAAFEGPNTADIFNYEGRSWFKYVFPEDGSVTVSDCRYNIYGTYFYVYKGFPKYDMRNDYYDNGKLFTDPNLLSYGNYNCEGEGSQVKINGKKGESILINVLAGYNYNLSIDNVRPRFDIFFAKTILPAGTDRNTPHKITEGTASYAILNFSENKNFAFFKFSPPKTGKYKLTFPNSEMDWDIADKDTATSYNKDQGHIFTATLGTDYWFGLRCYNHTQSDTFPATLTLVETTENPVTPCDLVIPSTVGQVINSDFSTNTQRVYSFTTSEEGELHFKMLNGSNQYITIFDSCTLTHEMGYGSISPGYDYVLSVGANQTIYVELKNYNFEQISWTTSIVPSTYFTSFNISNQVGETFINPLDSTVNVEVKFDELGISSLYSWFSVIPESKVFKQDSVEVSYYDYFDYTSPFQLRVESITGKSKVWTINLYQAAQAYTGADVDSLYIDGQIGNIVRVNDTTFTAVVKWNSSNSYNTTAFLSKGANGSSPYVYFNTDETSDTLLNFTVYSQDYSFYKDYTLSVHRDIPQGSSCSNAINAVIGTNSGAWVNEATFMFTTDTACAIKISNTDQSGYFYLYDVCDDYSSPIINDFMDMAMARTYAIAPGTYYFKFYSNFIPVNKFDLNVIPVPVENDITSISIYNATNEVISPAGKTAVIYVPFNYEFNSDTYVNFTITQGAKAYFEGSQVSGYFYNDFSVNNPVILQVVAMNGDTADWTISALRNPGMSDKNFLSYVLPQQIAPAKIGPNTIDILVAPGTDVSAMVPSFRLSPGAWAKIAENPQYSLESVVDFTKPVIYKLMAEDSSTMDWTVNVYVSTPSAANVLKFDLHGQVQPGSIDPATNTINSQVLDLVNIKSIATYFTLSPGASATIGGNTIKQGDAIDYTVQPVQLKVTSADKMTKIWNLNVKQIVAGECNAAFDYKVEVNGVIFNNSSTGSNLACIWDFGDGSNSSIWSAAHSYTKSGTYKVTLTINDMVTQCNSVISKDVVVVVVEPVIADFTFVSSPASLEAAFTNASSENASTYVWNFGDGKYSVEKSPTHLYDYPGYYYVCLQSTAATGAGSTKCQEVSVGDVFCDIYAWFDYTANDKDVSFTDMSEGTYDVRYWNFGDGQTATDSIITHSYDKPGYYEVSLSVKKSGSTCFDTYYAYILAGTADCKAAFTSVSDAALKNVKFTNTSSGNVSYYYWDFGDGTYSEEMNPDKTYENNGVYYVSLTVSDESGLCMDYIYEEVKLGESNCNASFTYFADPLTLTLYLSSADNSPSTQYLWVMGDGTMSTAKNPVHAFKYGGYYNIALTTFDLTNSCMDSYEALVLVGEPGVDCEAGFAYMPSGLNVNFTDKSKGDIILYVWNFGDGSNYETTPNPPHTFNAGGYYNVCLTVLNSNFVPNTTCQEIGVALDESNNCNAKFSYVVDSITRKASFVDESFGKPISWEWSFGDNSTDVFANPVHIYETKGYYLVSLKTTNEAGCSSVKYELLNAGEKQSGLKVVFVATQDPTGKKAGGYPVDFTGAGLGDEARLKWDFGDGETDSTSTTPSHAYDENGTYNVCYTVYDPVSGDSSQYCQDVVYTGAVRVSTVSIENKISAYPVPMATNLNIQFYLNKNSLAAVEIVDLMGKRVALVAQRQFNQGVNSLQYNVSALKRGAYILRVSSNGEAPSAIMLTK